MQKDEYIQGRNKERRKQKTNIRRRIPRKMEGINSSKEVLKINTK